MLPIKAACDLTGAMALGGLDSLGFLYVGESEEGLYFRGEKMV